MEKGFKETMIYKTTVTRKPPKDSLTTVYLLPGYAEVCINEGRSKSVIRNYRKIGGGKVINTVTGEIKEVSMQKKARSLNRSFQRLRRLINNNFFGKSNEIHITLTLKDEFKDLPLKELNNNYKKFWKCFVYRYPDSKYVVIREISPRGRMHFHVLIRNDKCEVFNVEKLFIEEKWPWGFIHINHISNNDNIGAYFTVFDDLLPELVEKQKNGEVNLKRSYIKKFPKGEHLYDKSRALKYPEPHVMTWEEAEKTFKGSELNFSKTLEIATVDEDGVIIPLNFIHYREYSRRRK